MRKILFRGLNWVGQKKEGKRKRIESKMGPARWGAEGDEKFLIWGHKELDMTSLLSNNK